MSCAVSGRKYAGVAQLPVLQMGNHEASHVGGSAAQTSGWKRNYYFKRLRSIGCQLITIRHEGSKSGRKGLAKS